MLSGTATIKSSTDGKYIVGQVVSVIDGWYLMRVFCRDSDSKMSASGWVQQQGGWMLVD